MSDTTRAEALRKVANASRRSLQRARDAYDAYGDDIETIRSAMEAIETADLAAAAQTVGELADEVAGLVELGLLKEDDLESLRETAGRLDTLADGDLSEDRLKAFVEAYEELGEALEAFEEAKEADSYQGKADDVENAWQDVVPALEQLADAADELDLS